MSGTSGAVGSSDSGAADPEARRAEEAERHVAALLRAAQARAVAHGAVPEPRKGSAKARRPGSLRHIAAVVAELRLYDLAATPDGPDHNPIDQALKGKSGRVANVDLVLAIARACHHIAGEDFGDAEARTYTDAARRADTLRRRAEIAAKAGPPPEAEVPAENQLLIAPPGERRFGALAFVAALVAVAAVSSGVTFWATHAARSDPAAPAAATASSPTVLSCQDGAADAGIIAAPAAVFADNQATMILPTLDFDTMNGSARYLSHEGRKYYWGRAGSDDHDPRAGGVRLLWRLDGETAWHECRTALPETERDYVRTPAVPTVIGNRTVTIKVCLWRDDPYAENCTQEQ